MPSPRGIFVGLTAVQLQAKIDSALDRIENGDRTSLSGGGKSASRNWPMSPEDVLFEARYALNKLNGTLPARRTYYDVNPIA